MTTPWTPRALGDHGDRISRSGAIGATNRCASRLPSASLSASPRDNHQAMAKATPRWARIMAGDIWSWPAASTAGACRWPAAAACDTVAVDSAAASTVCPANWPIVMSAAIGTKERVLVPMANLPTAQAATRPTVTGTEGGLPCAAT